jgi:hypothetical protein
MTCLSSKEKLTAKLNSFSFDEFIKVHYLIPETGFDKWGQIGPAKAFRGELVARDESDEVNRDLFKGLQEKNILLLNHPRPQPVTLRRKRARFTRGIMVS